MNLGRHVRGAALAAALLVLTVGCTSGSADGPTSTDIVSVTVSPSVIDPSSLRPSSGEPSPSSSASVPSSVVESSGSAPPSSEISPQEAADRAAIEAQWVKFWDVYQGIVRASPDQRRDLAGSVAVPALADKLVSAAEKAQNAHKDNYGAVVHHIFWQFEVDGKSTAVIADCLDQGNAGTIDTSTGDILTTGPQQANMRGELSRGEDNVWRVVSVTSLNSTAC